MSKKVSISGVPKKTPRDKTDKVRKGHYTGIEESKKKERLQKRLGLF